MSVYKCTTCGTVTDDFTGHAIECNKRFREMVSDYMMAELDIESDGLGPLTDEQIDKYIEDGIDHFGTKGELYRVLKSYFGA